MTSAAAPTEGRVFHTLDALRGIAAIGVVIFHMQLAFNPLGVPGGYLAVDLFFMMSGVVLSHAYEPRFQAGMGVVDFMRARFIRLYPLYLLGTMFGIAVTLASMRGHNSQGWDAPGLLQAAARAVVFVPNFSRTPVDEMFPLNIPCWSLFLELVVNLLFVVAWPLLTFRRLIGICLLSGAGVLVAIIHAGSIDQGSVAASLHIGLARTLFVFCIGVLIARHLRHRPYRESNAQVLVIAALVVLAITAAVTGAWRAGWDAACVLVVFPLLVFWGTSVDPGPRVQKIAAFLGVTSYAIYVLHSPLAAVLNSVSRVFAGGVAAVAPYAGVAVLVLLLLGCWIIDRCIDIPIRRHLARVVPRMQTLTSRS